MCHISSFLIQYWSISIVDSTAFPTQKSATSLPLLIYSQKFMINCNELQYLTLTCTLYVSEGNGEYGSTFYIIDSYFLNSGFAAIFSWMLTLEWISIFASAGLCRWAFGYHFVNFSLKMHWKIVIESWVWWWLQLRGPPIKIWICVWKHMR